MYKFEADMANYMYHHSIDPVGDAVKRKGVMAKYYHRDAMKLEFNTVHIRRDANGHITNKSHIVRFMLAKCPQFKQYALKLYVANNIDLTNPANISFAVLAQLPKIFIDVEKSTHAEVDAILKQYPKLSGHTRQWIRDALTIGCFRLNQITETKFEILSHAVDMIGALRASFQFINARSKHYFGS